MYIVTEFLVTETEDDDNDANESDKSTDDKANAGFCLTLPGRKLYIQPLLFMKKFKNRGNKRGAVKAIILLEQEGLGRVIQIRSSKSSVMVSCCGCSFAKMYICMYQERLNKYCVY